MSVYDTLTDLLDESGNNTLSSFTYNHDGADNVVSLSWNPRRACLQSKFHSTYLAEELNGFSKCSSSRVAAV